MNVWTSTDRSDTSMLANLPRDKPVRLNVLYIWHDAFRQYFLSQVYVDIRPIVLTTQRLPKLDCFHTAEFVVHRNRTRSTIIQYSVTNEDMKWSHVNESLEDILKGSGGLQLWVDQWRPRKHKKANLGQNLTIERRPVGYLAFGWMMITVV